MWVVLCAAGTSTPTRTPTQTPRRTATAEATSTYAVEQDYCVIVPNEVPPGTSGNWVGWGSELVRRLSIFRCPSGQLRATPTYATHTATPTGTAIPTTTATPTVTPTGTSNLTDGYIPYYESSLPGLADSTVFRDPNVPTALFVGGTTSPLAAFIGGVNPPGMQFIADGTPGGFMLWGYGATALFGYGLAGGSLAAPTAMQQGDAGGLSAVLYDGTDWALADPVGVSVTQVGGWVPGAHGSMSCLNGIRNDETVLYPLLCVGGPHKGAWVAQPQDPNTDTEEGMFECQHCVDPNDVSWPLGVPDPNDCDEAGEIGRWYHDPNGDAVYICNGVGHSGTSGWGKITLTF